MVSNLGSSILSDPIGSGAITSSPRRVGARGRVTTSTIPAARAVEVQLIQIGELCISVRSKHNLAACITHQAVVPRLQRVQVDGNDGPPIQRTQEGQVVRCVCEIGSATPSDRVIDPALSPGRELGVQCSTGGFVEGR